VRAGTQNAFGHTVASLRVRPPGGFPWGPERKNSVAHTVRAPAGLRLGAYASLVLRRAFANPAPTVSAL